MKITQSTLTNNEEFISNFVDLKIITSDADRITLNTIAADPGYIVIADVWYPGWRAYVDGKSVPILRANYLFKAVPVSKGEHEVNVVYQPKLIYLGAGLSGLTLATLIILVAFWLGKYRSKMIA